MVNTYNIGHLTDVKLKKDSRGEYCLCVTYTTKDDHDNIHELVIDGVQLPIDKDPRYITIETEISAHPSSFIDTGCGRVKLSVDAKFVDRIVEYSTKEMTIEEIEKKLGHKIRIVNKKEESNGDA